MHECVIGGRARERENMDTRAYNVGTMASMGGCGKKRVAEGVRSVYMDCT